ncbi:MAG: oligosaccharyl transferase, archaeosortase A system-associated [Methanocalculaceae archaeon]|jgi:dolichyl-diphosphooligosaccharide--protein glycosyltransferase|nr:oligosaccharyl transferase, archaeosortase A system-associated [Methanocalculaceae archaeon]
MDLNFWSDRRYRYGILGGIVLILAVLAFWIRILPFSYVSESGNMIAGPDGWYNLRLIEVALANNFGYLSFDPMTLYPTGQDVVWGPLFTWIAAAFVAAAGAVTRMEVIVAANWVLALMGAAMVPVMYLFGALIRTSNAAALPVSQFGNWKTGLVSALFIAVIGGQYLVRSLYGYLDHHIAETLFSTLFCLLYVMALYVLQDYKIDLKEYATLKIPVLYGVICGIAYFFGLLTMTTMVVFGLFIAILTLLQFIMNHRSGKPTEYLLVLNVITFATVVIGMLIYGIQSLSFSFTTYSLGILCAHLGLILGTIVLYAVSSLFRRSRNCRVAINAYREIAWYYYPVALGVLGVIVLGIAAVALPYQFGSAMGGMRLVFSSGSVQTTIAEMAPWSLNGMFTSFGLGILLAVGGFAYLLYRVWKHEEPGALFVLIWSALMMYATMQHVRWEYYVAANITLLAAVFVGWAFTFAEKDLVLVYKSAFASRFTVPHGLHPAPRSIEQKIKPLAQKGKKAAAKAAAGPDWMKIRIFAVVAIATIVFAAASVDTAVKTGEGYGKYGGTEKDWISECIWMHNGTPETGVDYLTLYNKGTFTYPNESYGVLSWWDYGHVITAVAERIPTSNPFQAGVAGPYGAAAILTCVNESAVMEKLDHLRARYVMTDYEMAGGKFGAMAIWNNSSAQLTPYLYTFLQQNITGQLSSIPAYTPEYYNTLTVRLQYYDGSMTEPGDVLVVCTDTKRGYNYPVVTQSKRYPNATEAEAAADQYNSAASATTHAYVIADLEKNWKSPAKALLPSVTVPALQHFRLVHELPMYILFNSSNGRQSSKPIEGGTALVKSFEYVPGAVIKGNGIIEVNVTTNNGRAFIYRQKSTDGLFVVPYSTFGSSYDVKTTGPYTIVGTGEIFEVPEDAVMQGRAIN